MDDADPTSTFITTAPFLPSSTVYNTAPNPTLFNVTHSDFGGGAGTGPTNSVVDYPHVFDESAGPG